MWLHAGKVRMMPTMKWREYTASIDFDQELRKFHGRVLNANSVISFYGSSVEELEREFEASMLEYMRVCEENGIAPDRPYSGRVNLRVPPDLHRDLAIAAAAEGQSINEWAVKHLDIAIHGQE